jgi:hypothetical protein
MRPRRRSIVVAVSQSGVRMINELIELLYLPLPGDDSMKLWDLRNFKKPVNVALNLPNAFLT